MNEFIPRTRAPAASNPCWINTQYGGYNKCIVIRPNGSVLPNCTGYAWGRWRELLGKDPKLSTGHARNWYGYLDGYSRGKVPALGAVACWGGTKYGHVAIVESIGPNYIMVSQSNYGGAAFEYVRCNRQPGGGYTSHLGNTAFQGFIYIPIAYNASGTGDPPINPYKSVDEIARAIIRGTGPWYKCYGQQRWDKIKSYGYDPQTVQKRINEILKGE
jgi:surface antigen